MTRLIELTKRVQLENDLESLETILHLFEPKMKQSLLQTNFQEREDLLQELQIKTIDIIKNYDWTKGYTFWEYTEKLQSDYYSTFQEAN
ncbi:helix-turn-helix domain-containing protein [Oceanobacillus sp. 1P07AA]|uniref:helix-turn-helix domain-containing protein n=1 Tax=Oceanobacillus sp. 1P07AA TaxID=3132293 RepID=UPI0039A727EF